MNKAITALVDFILEQLMKSYRGYVSPNIHSWVICNDQFLVSSPWNHSCLTFQNGFTSLLKAGHSLLILGEKEPCIGEVKYSVSPAEFWLESKGNKGEDWKYEPLFIITKFSVINWQIQTWKTMQNIWYWKVRCFYYAELAKIICYREKKVIWSTDMSYIVDKNANIK